MDENGLKELFEDVIDCQMHHRSAMRELDEWNEKLKDDTGGYRGGGDRQAREWEEQCREEYRQALDAYIAARFSLARPAEGENP